MKNKNITKINFVPLKIHEKLDLESLNLASHKIDNINDIIDQMENETIFDKVVNNVYYAYIFFSILKIMFMVYILYRVARYLKRRHFFYNRNDRLLALEDTRTCCARITNCITLKVNNDNRERDIEFEEMPSTSENSNTSLRRSARIAQFKVN